MWRYPQVGQGDSCGGILTPAGGLLFLGMMPARWRRWKPRLADLSGISIPAKAFAPLRWLTQLMRSVRNRRSRSDVLTFGFLIEPIW